MTFGALTPRRRRLMFRALHRGTHENDLMIGGFVAAGIKTFSDAELEALEALMELPDVLLSDWLCGRREIPTEEASPMLLEIRAFVAGGGAMTRP